MIRFSLARPVYRPKKATNVSIYKNVWIALHARFPHLIGFFNLTDSLFPRRLLSSNFTKLSPCADIVYFSDRENQTAVSQK